MTGTIFVGLVAALLLVAGLTTIIVQYYGKSKETKSYTYLDEKKFRSSGIEESYGQDFDIVLSSLREANPWFIKVVIDEDYLNEALSITSRSGECKNSLDVFKVIDEEFFSWRGYGSLNPQFYDRIEDVSKRIWPVWDKGGNV